MFLKILFLSIIFGVTQKLADAVNEHNVNLFKNSNWFFGILFGLSGGFLSIHNSSFAIYFFCLVCYWLIKNKLDYQNHQISAMIILFFVIFHSELRYLFTESIIVFLLFLILDFLSKKIKSKKVNLFIFKMRFVLISLLVGFLNNDYYLPFSVFLTILSILYTTKYLKSNFNYLE
ncbi:MAG: hypothetical protein COZ18_16910 [Flexibacter sp. CG_4_10_14_3_um_filter_32_15]|nr:MAG: hypothetical protein COZ18_16910 [Flexibacter sp. CG_4_10_14_3_um_filter_32_15]